MPIYEFTCKKCSHHFDVLVYGKGKEISCPQCKSKNLEKGFSSFAAISSSSKSVDPSCATPSCGYDAGACGSGMCRN